MRRHSNICISRDSVQRRYNCFGKIWIMNILAILLLGLVLVDASIQTPPREIIVGISFGDTHSSVAVLQQGKMEIIPNEHGKTSTPSWVSFSNKQPLVGQSAKDAFERYPNHTIFHVRRLLGRSFEEGVKLADERDWPFEIVNQKGKAHISIQTYNGETKIFSPEEISATMLRKLKKDAEAYTGVEISAAAVTVPSYFDETQRKAVREAGRLAGLNILRTINEPVASAIAYELDKHRKEQNIIVFDLGEETVDISIVNIDDGVYEILSTCHDTRSGVDASDGYPLEHYPVLVQRALEEANLTTANINTTIATGHSAELPKLHATLHKYLNKAPLTQIDPAEAAVRGAAIQGAVLSIDDVSGCPSVDLNPLTVGVETANGLFAKLALRSYVVPLRRKYNFTTAFDNQTSVLIKVYEGERLLAQDNTYLGSLQLFGIPPALRGVPQIEVTFALDWDSVVDATATLFDTSNNNNSQPSPSLWHRICRLLPYAKCGDTKKQPSLATTATFRQEWRDVRGDGKYFDKMVEDGERFHVVDEAEGRRVLYMHKLGEYVRMLRERVYDEEGERDAQERQVSDNNTDDVSVKMISLLREIRKWVEAFGSYELPKQNDIIDAKRIGLLEDVNEVLRRVSVKQMQKEKL